MFAVLMTFAAMQLGGHDALATEIERFGRFFVYSNACAGAGYEIAFDPLHDMQERIESRASETGISAAELSRRINESVARHETDLPPRELPENAAPSQFQQFFRDAMKSYPLHCGQLAREAPEVLTSDSLILGDRQLIERMEQFDALFAQAPGSQ